MIEQAEALWSSFSASPSTSQSSFWAAYSSMAAYNAPYGQILANMQPFESLGVTSQVRVAYLSLTPVRKAGHL